MWGDDWLKTVDLGLYGGPAGDIILCYYFLEKGLLVMTYQEEFITFMVRSGVLTFGDFTTKSGRKTPYFINTGNYKTGAQAAKLGDYYACLLYTSRCV